MILWLQLFSFAKNHRGLYQNSVPGAAKFYASSGDEVLPFTSKSDGELSRKKKCSCHALE
jgi:hypothetical protein